VVQAPTSRASDASIGSVGVDVVDFFGFCSNGMSTPPSITQYGKSLAPDAAIRWYTTRQRSISGRFQRATVTHFRYTVPARRADDPAIA
jgi:hypothetical protein